jgi:GH24 family phage-related lysozyme (muramidase)
MSIIIYKFNWNSSRLTFNIGPGNLQKSHLLADINAGNCDPATIQADFALLPGDPNRRMAEANMFNNGVY